MNALDVARDLIRMGAPVFVAKKCKPDCPAHRGRGSMAGFDLPMRWQHTPVSEDTLARYEPGDALAMVGGHALDAIDVDPRNTGTLAGKPDLPRVYAEAATPSGGKHYIVKSLGVPKGEVFDGIDLQAGDALDTRGFVWIAPTIKASQDPADDGRMRPYVWIKKPDLDEWSEWSDSDDSGEVWRDARLARGAGKKKEAPSAPGDPFGANPEAASAREFTREQAQAHVRPFLTELAAQTRTGKIEELANAAATALFHFVPEFWSADAAYGLLEKSAKRALNGSWRDGESEWSLEKFRAVIDGRRAPKDAWKATIRAEEVLPEAPAVPDRLAVMRSKLLDYQALLDRPAPKPLIKGIVDLDSECWLIGKSGEYKSFVAVDWACHVATGREWRGRRVKQGRVLYVAAEGAAGIGKRVQGWALHNEVEPKDLAVLPMPVQVLSGDFEVLTLLAAELEPAMIVLDTQARMTAGMDENSAQDMGRFVQAVSTLREVTGACVLTVHHVGRNGMDARGSSAIDAAQDWEWKCERPGKTLQARLSCQKSKDDSQDQKFDFDMRVIGLGLDDDGDPVTTLVPGQELTQAERPTYEDKLKELDADSRWAGEQARVMKALRTLTADGATAITKPMLMAEYNVLRKAVGQEPVSRGTFHTTVSRMLKQEEEALRDNSAYKPEIIQQGEKIRYLESDSPR